MSQQQNSRIAQHLLAGIGEGSDPGEIAALFNVDVQFEIAGDVGALPWIGRRDGQVEASSLDVATPTHLLEQGDRARRVLQNQAGDRAKVVEAYHDVLNIRATWPEAKRC